MHIVFPSKKLPFHCYEFSPCLTLFFSWVVLTKYRDLYSITQEKQQPEGGMWSRKISPFSTAVKIKAQCIACCFAPIWNNTGHRQVWPEMQTGPVDVSAVTQHNTGFQSHKHQEQECFCWYYTRKSQMKSSQFVKLFSASSQIMLQPCRQHCMKTGWQPATELISPPPCPWQLWLPPDFFWFPLP